MKKIDYSLHYLRFHDDSEGHAEAAARWHGNLLAPYVPSDLNSPILDIGCGFGFALRGLRNLGFKDLTGLEMSPDQADRCRKAGFNVFVTENSESWLRSNGGRFAFVVLEDVLEHVPVANQIDFASAIYAALMPGGRVFVTVPNADAILASRWRYIDYTHHCSFTEHSLHFVLKNAGFGSVQIDNEKGIGRCPRRFWRRSAWPAIRKWIIRWCWLQIHESELAHDLRSVERICFELNLKAVATKD